MNQVIVGRIYNFDGHDVIVRSLSHSFNVAVGDCVTHVSCEWINYGAPWSEALRPFVLTLDDFICARPALVR